MITTLWLLWFLALAALEFHAVGNPEPGDTLTEHVRAIMAQSYWLRLGVCVFLAWLWVHFGGVSTIAETFRRLFGAWL